MYIDVIVLLLLLILIIVFFRRFDSFIYGFAIIDITLRILAYIGTHVPVPELQALINKYFPVSIAAIIGKNSEGIIYDILMWIYVGLYTCFLFYIIRYFIKKKK